MSWRFIFAFLIVIFGASAWAGLRLGDWLVAHGPAITVTPEMAQIAAVPVLDADGNPYVARPPQPLIDGRLGLQQPIEQIAWEIPEQSLDETKANNVIAVSTTSITMVEAQQIAAGAGSKLSGIADVGNLLSPSDPAAQQPLQPVEITGEPFAPVVTAAPVGSGSSNNTSWQASLRQDLQACNAESFFDRPSCAWAARNKYCTPNSGWGRVEDCPSKF